MKRLSVFILSFMVSLGRADGDDSEYWYPNQNPAMIERKITAFTTPSRTLEVSAEFAGRVESIAVNEGETIQGNSDSRTPVVTLDTRFVAIAKDRAETALKKAITEVEQSKTELALAERQLEFHRHEVKRIESLASSGKIRKSDLDAAKFEADRSALQVERAQSTLALADTAIEDARHQLADVVERLDRHSIDVPSGWVVLERLVEPGTIVNAGQTLLRLADVSELAIELRLSEAEITALKQDEDILLTFRHHNFNPVKAQIYRIDVNHDPVTNKRLVELRIPGESAPAPSGGLEVSLTLTISDPSGLILVPEDFLTLRFEQYFVTFKDGKESSVIPLREQGKYVLISGQELPDSAVLKRPQSSVP